MTWFEFYFLTKTAGFSSFSSIEELAAHLDVSPSTIRRWCKTDRPPKAFFLLEPVGRRFLAFRPAVEILESQSAHRQTLQRQTRLLP